MNTFYTAASIILGLALIYALALLWIGIEREIEEQKNGDHCA